MIRGECRRDHPWINVISTYLVANYPLGEAVERFGIIMIGRFGYLKYELDITGGDDYDYSIYGPLPRPKK